MTQFVNQSQVQIGNGKGIELPVAAELAPPRPGSLLLKWKTFLAGPRLPRATALAIIQLVSLLFWISAAGGIYYFWHR